MSLHSLAVMRRMSDRIMEKQDGKSEAGRNIRDAEEGSRHRNVKQGYLLKLHSIFHVNSFFFVILQSLL